METTSTATATATATANAEHLKSQESEPEDGEYSSSSSSSTGSQSSPLDDLVAAATARSALEEETSRASRVNSNNNVSFPEKLMSIVQDPEEDAIQWNASGTRFGIIPTSFAKNVVPKHFQGSKFESFLRKLSRWSFQRVVDRTFPDGALVYQNDLFVRGKEHLLSQMKGTKSKQSKAAAAAAKPKATNAAAQRNNPSMQGGTPAPSQTQVPTSLPRYSHATTANVAVSTADATLLSGITARRQLEESRLLALMQQQQQRGSSSSLLLQRAAATAAASQQQQQQQQFHSMVDIEIQRLCQLQQQRDADIAATQLRLSSLLQQQQQQQQQLSPTDQLLLNHRRLLLQQQQQQQQRNDLTNLANLLGIVPELSSAALIGMDSSQETLLLRARLLATTNPAAFTDHLSGRNEQVSLFAPQVPTTMPTMSISGPSTLLDNSSQQASTTATTTVTATNTTTPEEALLSKARQREEASGETFSQSEQRQPSRFQEQQWDEHFKELACYREKYGNCLVPQHTFHESPKLARWVKRQRYQYKLLKDGRPSNITMERVKALEKIGFVWDSHSAVWHERMEELKAFKKAHSHCNVPTTYAENRKLAAWVKCQRRQYKLRLEGKASNMTPERIQDLEAVGFEWLLRSYRSTT